MKSQLRLIKSLLSLVFALFLCIGVGYAWFTINSTSEVENIALSVLAEEEGYIEFDEFGTSDNSNQILPNQTATYDLVCKNNISSLVISVTQDNPSKTDFDRFFVQNHPSLLNCDYLINYLNNEDLVASYKYDISNKTNIEKSDFLYSFTTSNAISRFINMQVKLEGDEDLYDFVYNKNNNTFTLNTNLVEDQKFKLILTFGNGENPEVEASNQSENLSCTYVCENYNCFLLSKIKMSFGLSN